MEPTAAASDAMDNNSWTPHRFGTHIKVLCLGMERISFTLSNAVALSAICNLETWSVRSSARLFLSAQFAHNK
jgi:hypothetical protein